ncbi:TonB-dependent receptor [Acidicapsa acidisoli]|uniref:TonB-dependent receptor n=1 Tax=Acidicapsa acidisoli TaxID=1615681 RepID=UPI0021DF9DC4|nr:TonB-dependent receptor [Acidicapsa acidisoli]
MHRTKKQFPFVTSSATIRHLRFSIGLSALLFLASLCAAQVDRSGLTGTVTDPSGRLLPQAHITAVQNSTELRRETVSNSAGRYDLPELPVGVYTVTVDHPGFKALTFVDVEQVIGRTRTLDATLRVAGGEERVEVPASSALIDRNTSAVTGLIEKTQAEELPLNGRNWSELTAFVPGVVDIGGSNQRSVRFAGRGTDDDNFSYDGVDATNIVNQAQRAWVRLAIPLDAIQEVRVDSLLSPAEAGATGGPQLAVTSPSGTNQFHGRLFEYLRNDDFDATEPAWASGGEAQQPLRLNQFGGSLGGPIVRDKTFFFIASEAYRQNWGYPVIGYVPTPAFRATVASNSPIYPIINAFPLAGPRTILIPGVNSDPNIDELVCACEQVVNESSAMIRLDHRFSAKTTSFMRFNYDRSVDTQPYAVTASDLQQQVSAPVNGALQLLHIFNPHLANEAKFGFNRDTSNTYSYSENGTYYQVAVTALSTQNYNRVSIGVGNSFSGIDNLTWVHGQHTVKAGVEIRRIQMNQGKTISGKITFTSVENLAANEVSKVTLSDALPINGLRKTDYIGYIQDEFKWRQNFTLNLGARYTVFDVFHEVNGKPNPFDFATCGSQGFCGVGASFGQQNYGDFDPRVAFSWSPDRPGKTVIRAGFGMYHEDGQLDDQNLPESNEVGSYSLTKCLGAKLTYPISTSCFTGPGTISPQAQDRRRKDTYTEQWSASVQRELPADFVGTLSYVGSHGLHLLTISQVNMIDPATGTAPYPAFAPAINWRGTQLSSTYNGFLASLRRPFTHGLLVAANYAYTHEIDDDSDGSGDGDSQVPQNVACASCDRASGNWDARHVFNANAVYQLPFGMGKPMLNQRGIASSIAGNWELTTTALARTGFPINVILPSSYTAPDGNNAGTQRPDLVPGVSLTPPGGKSVAEWMNPAAFATPAGEFGDTPRNFLRGPGTWQMDFGASKTIPLRERALLQFRSEFYNIFNHPQLGQPQSTFNPSNTTGFGSILNTVNLNTSIVSPITPVGSGTPREMQFALRLEF